ncbi:MAG: 50S ribosomal protein L4 [Gemmatimonadales bacterium]
MIEAPHFSATGARHEAAFALPEEPFDGLVNEPVLHQAVTTFLANQRQGTHQTKTRHFVSGGNQKPWRQKGTGRARQGSIRAPHWRGGGIVFGPHPRDYRIGIPRKVRQLARRSALNARAGEGALVVVDALAFRAPKTRQLAELLDKLGLLGRKVLVLSNGGNRNLYLSGRNIPGVEITSWSDVSAYEILWSDTVVVEQGALTGDPPAVPEPVEGEAPEAASRAARAKAAPRKKAAPKGKAAPKAKAAARKPAAKKPAAKKPAAKKKKERE